MLSTQTNIALQLVASLTPEEILLFAAEFEKLKKGLAISKPKKIKVAKDFDHHKMAQYLLDKHRMKQRKRLESIPDASKLA